MKVYRIAKRKHASDMSGTGASIYPGRWNKKGTPVMYTSETIELALLEIVVHTPPMFVPDFEILTIEMPDDSIFELEISDLPSNWKQYPPPVILSEIGEKWVKAGKTVALKVPSSIVHTSHNYILNCNHSRYSRVKLLEHDHFYFDPRLTS